MPTTAPKTATAPRRTFRSLIRPRIASVVVIAAAAALVAGCASERVEPAKLGSSGNAGIAQSGNAGSSVAQSSAGPASTAPFFLNDGTCPSSATDPAVAKLKADKTPVPLPADFHPVAAVRCGTMTHTVAGQGEWQFADAQRADSKLGGLLAALRLPSETPTATEIACAAIGMVGPDFGLVDATGRVVRPRLPQSVCGLPLEQVLTALNGLPWRTETEQRLRQTQSQPALDSGCYPQYKDELELRQPASAEPWSKVRHPASTGPALACEYVIKHRASSGSIDVGDFVRGLKLDSAQEATVEQALTANGDKPAPMCSAKATRFVVLTTSVAPGVVVELDGCPRVLWPNGFVSPAEGALVNALRGLGLS